MSLHTFTQLKVKTATTELNSPIRLRFMDPLRKYCLNHLGVYTVYRSAHTREVGRVLLMLNNMSIDY